MLIFAPKIKCQRPRFRVCTDSRYVVDASPIWSPVIVNNGLSEVISIPEWSTGNSRDTRVDRIQAYT